jgi:AraC-like DNA-binding protein
VERPLSTLVIDAACSQSLELLVQDQILSIAIPGSMPGIRADAGKAHGDKAAAGKTSGFSVRQLRSVMTELCTALRSALDDERDSAEECLRRAAELLQTMEGAAAPAEQPARGGLCPWQIRKVTSYIEAHLDRPVRNDDLAALVRLNPSHFGRAFRNSVGESPHEYLIRRRVERAQGLMLSTRASLSEIALDCGLADQSHLTRLFRRIVGESPSAWRRSRISAPI